MKNRKYVIVGGVAGGATTAARLRRMDEHAQIIMLEKGPHISYANCGLPYYIGGVIKDRDKLLVQTPESFGSRFNIDVRIYSEVTDIDADGKTIQVKDHQNQETYSETYDDLVLSPGALPVKPPVFGIDQKNIFTLRNVDDTDCIKNFVDAEKPRSAVVVGAGFIGLEMAENLHHQGVKVSVVEAAPQVMNMMDPEMAAVEPLQRRLDGVAHRRSGGRRQAVAPIPGVLDDLLQVRMGGGRLGHGGWITVAGGSTGPADWAPAPALSTRAAAVGADGRQPLMSCSSQLPIFPLETGLLCTSSESFIRGGARISRHPGFPPRHAVTETVA